MVTVATARANILATDNFESYAVGNLEDGGGNVPNGGSGWANPWEVADSWRDGVQVVNHAMNYSNGSVSINSGSQALQVDVPNTTTAVPLARQFAGQTGTLYMSFLLEAPTISDNIAPNSTDDFFQFGFDTNGVGASNNTRASGGIADDASQQKFFTRDGTQAADSVFGPVVNPTTTYLLVLKIEKNGSSYDEITLFINPDSTDENTQTSTVVATGASTLVTPSFFLFRFARHEVVDSYYLDRFRLGTDFESVVIPEPATLVLLGLGALSMMRRRRGA
jgi:hypothetical protein